MTRSKILASLSFNIERFEKNYSKLSLHVTYDIRGPLSQFGRKALVEEIADSLLKDITRSIVAEASDTHHKIPENRSFKVLPFMGTVLKSLIMRLFRQKKF